MDHLVTFLEGIVTFISPCLLPMLPIYLAYFAGSSNKMLADGATSHAATLRTIVNALGFVLGFTIVFLTLGALAGTLGQLLARYQAALNIVCGALVILFGLHFAGILRIPLLNRTIKPDRRFTPGGFGAAILFGIFFSIGWTPCVGAFLGSALALASTSGSVLRGVTLLLAYSVGLGIPFVASALIVEQLAGAFEFIKKHYKTINLVCGILLVIVGVLMATGLFGTWLSMLTV